MGDGKSIRIWEEPWVSHDGNRFLEGDHIEGAERVCDLIDTNECSCCAEQIIHDFLENSA